MYAMREGRSAHEHERAAFNYADAVPFAVVDCLLTGGSLLACTVHPYPSDTHLGTLLHNLLSLPERSHEKNAVHCRAHAVQRLKTFFAFDVFREEIDGHHVIAALAHLAEQRSAEVFRIARYADHGDAALAKEIIDVGSGGHRSLLL